jgi:prepilin peptidase CpaA
MFPPLLFDTLSLGAAAFAALTDLRTGRIPNRLTVPVMLGGVGLHAALGGEPHAVASLAGLLLAGLVPWLCFRSTGGRALGGGDVKLFAGLGALRGATEGLEIELSACILVAVLALVRLAFRGELSSVLSSAVHLLLDPLLPERWRREPSRIALTELRLGPAILGAVVYVCAADRFGHVVSWLA